MIKAFVVGCPRSGTTLVQKLLGAHSDVYTCKETFYFLRIRRRGIGKLLDYLALSPSRVSEAYSFIRANDQLLRHHDLRGIRSMCSAAAFLDQLMTREAQARDKSAWVEKTPRHMFSIRLIERCIPSAQFVHVLRDGRDVVASLADAAEKYPQVWSRHADLGNAVSVYNRFLQESLKYCGRRGHVFVRYEHILDDAEGVSRSLYAALGLRDMATQLDLTEVHQRVVRDDERWKAGSEGEIQDTRLVKFDRLFDKEQQAAIVRGVRRIPPRLDAAVLTADG